MQGLPAVSCTVWESGGKRQEAFSSPEKVHPQLAHNLRPSGDLVANPGRRWLSFVVPGTGPRDVRCEGQGFSDKVERSLSEVRVVKPKLSVRSAVNLSNPVHLPVVFITKTQTGKVAGWIGRRCRVCREWLASRASPRFDSLGDRPTPSPSGVRVRFVGRACEGVEREDSLRSLVVTGLVSTDRARNWPHFPSGLITCQVFSVVRVADSFSLPALLVGGSLDLSVARLGPS